MNIGTVAEKSGVPPKTIRYYETIGLIAAADRRPNGYRSYSALDMRTLNFNLLLADRDVEIVADRGIHPKVGARGWEEICRKMEAAFAQGRYADGVIAGIQSVAQHLAEHFPARGRGADELPDKPVVL